MQMDCPTQEREMNDEEGLVYIRKYFELIFNGRNTAALEVFLAKEYDDDDIPDTEIDHIKNSREYLINLFQEIPTIKVIIHRAATYDNIIVAFIEWCRAEEGIVQPLKKGICLFTLNNENRIIKRHNYIYFDAHVF